MPAQTGIRLGAMIDSLVDNPFGLLSWCSASVDARPSHTETGLATRPILGMAPTLPEGLAPEAVAARIMRAIEAGRRHWRPPRSRLAS